MTGFRKIVIARQNMSGSVGGHGSLPSTTTEKQRAASTNTFMAVIPDIEDTSTAVTSSPGHSQFSWAWSGYEAERRSQSVSMRMYFCLRICVDYESTYFYLAMSVTICSHDHIEKIKEAS